jgi:hypothetical protein
VKDKSKVKKKKGKMKKKKTEDGVTEETTTRSNKVFDEHMFDDCQEVERDSGQKKEEEVIAGQKVDDLSPTLSRETHPPRVVLSRFGLFEREDDSKDRVLCCINVVLTPFLLIVHSMRIYLIPCFRFNHFPDYP